MAADDALLIRDATLLDGRRGDVLVSGGRIARIGCLPRETAPVLDARGGLLLPGLHDHHIHLAATAAAMASVRCGPPEVTDADQLAVALGCVGTGWLRGIGYHESVAGELDRAWLDRVAPHRPVRVQHRSGRLWIFNSAGLALLLATGHGPPAGLDRASGQLFDEDAWLRRALGGVRPNLSEVGRRLAAVGITGISDLTPANDDSDAAHFAAQHACGALPQRIVVAGRASLGDLGGATMRGPIKLHLHEAHLPDYDATVMTIRAAHDAGRAVAVHCVTETELVFTLAALAEAGSVAGDRIEHASIAPDHLVAEIARLGTAVVTQPHFVAERGDAYLADVAAADHAHLYRLRAFRDAGVPLAGGSDAPFGAPDPWAAMAAAVARRTRGGAVLGAGEALTPEEALALFLADPRDLSRTRRIEPGAPADLCLLDRPWAAARASLSADCVRATIIAGRIVHQRVDEAPVARQPRADALAR